MLGVWVLGFSFLGGWGCFFYETRFLFVALTGSHSVDQADLKITEVCLHLPPECAGVKGMPATTQQVLFLRQENLITYPRWFGAPM